MELRYSRFAEINDTWIGGNLGLGSLKRISAVLLMILLLSPCCDSLYAGRKSRQPAVASASVDFGSVTVGTSSTQVITVTNTGHSRATISTATVTGSGFSYSGPVLPLNLSRGQSANLSVTFLASVPGTSTGSLSLLNNPTILPNVISLAGTGTQPASSVVQSTLSVSSASISFGNVLVGSGSSQSVTVSNTGSISLSISQAAVSGSCFGVSGLALPLTLAPGQSSAFTTSFTPAATGSMTGGISLISDAANSPTPISISGTGVQPLISVAPSNVSFGNVPVGATSTQTVTVSNPGSANLNVTQAAGPGTGFSVSGLTMPLTVPPGQSAKFSIGFTPTVAGTLTSSVALVSNAPASPMPVSLSGAGVQPSSPQISVIPGNLTFGSVTVGGSGKQSLTVSNTGGASLSITAAQVTGSGFSTSSLSLPMTVAAGASGTITVAFAPSASGSVTGSLSLASDAPTSPTAIALSGAGVAPTLQLSASPSSLNFGSETVGNSSTQNVTLTNSSSSGSITVSAISISGPFASSGTTLPITLNAGQGLTLSVAFTPTAAGAATGTLTVTSTAGNSPTTVALVGSGTSSSPSPSGPVVINGQDGTVIQGLKITSTTGDCVQIINSTNITIQNSEIGPCSGGTSANAIRINGGNGINIYDSYIHPETLNARGCCDYDDGIFAYGGVQNLLIQGNVIAYGESNIEVQGGAAVNIVGNFLLNPRGPFPRGQNFQCWEAGGGGAPCSTVTVNNNYTLSSTDTTKYLYPENQEDSINFGFTNGAIAQSNFITGGHSASGCGLIADESANSMQFKSNLLLNTGQCGIGIADGTNQLVDSNEVYNTTPVTGAGNTAIYAWSQYTPACGPTTISNNIADEIRADGTHSGYWDGSGCSVTLSGNTFSAPADTLLTPTSTVFLPPLIPPQPKNCVVTSPYSTQTAWAPCTP
jgi:Abnormal spindle-like microcephaly-assoc'd, ASPM-SPD-2-Hydin/Right handed beta helix region